MKQTLSLLTILMILVIALLYQNSQSTIGKNVLSVQSEQSYWFILHRKSNREFLYYGEPDNIDNSQLVKIFKVKTGIQGERPTPLPQLLGRKYWIITDEFETPDNPETSPYFLTLDIPISEEEPFGPTPYLECNGQCNWILPGAFGLHGLGGDPEKISELDPGSSGCIRHSDEDITYLYNNLNPKADKIRYYIVDI